MRRSSFARWADSRALPFSFSIISILTGILTTYKTAIAGGGPAALGFGWPIVSVGAFVVALAMAELASAFPTAGALYHWSAVLGGPGWGWFTATMNLGGQFAIVAGIDYGCAKAACAASGWGHSALLPAFAVVLVSHAVFNIVSVRLVAWLNDLSAAVHIVGCLVLVALLLAWGRTQPFSFAFGTGFTTRSDGNYGLGFINALLLGMWTFTGFDASAHAAEETHDPARRAPWGIVSSVLVSAVTGYALVLALTWGIVDVARAASEEDPALAILQRALGMRAGSWAMGLGIMAMWFCGLSSVTSASRTLFAFARDDGLPGSAWIKRVSPTLKTPVVAIGVVSAASFTLVALATAMSDEVLVAVTSLATSALYVSYAVPITLGAIARRQRRWRTLGPWNLGRSGVAVAWVGAAWTAWVLLVCALPPNHVGGTLLLVLVIALAAFYRAFVRGKFRGPRVDLAALEGRQPNS